MKESEAGMLVRENSPSEHEKECVSALCLLFVGTLALLLLIHVVWLMFSFPDVHLALTVMGAIFVWGLIDTRNGWRQIPRWWRTCVIGRIAQFHYCNGEDRTKIFARASELKEAGLRCEACGGADHCFGFYFTVVLGGWFKKASRINRIEVPPQSGRYNTKYLNAKWRVYSANGTRYANAPQWFFLEDDQGTRMAVGAKLATEILGLSQGAFGSMLPGWRPIIDSALTARDELLQKQDRERHSEAEASCLHEVLLVAARQIRESVRFGRSTGGMQIRSWLETESIAIRHMGTEELWKHRGDLLQART